MQISLCMIVKDEQATLKRCLDSVASVVDEIVIVDTGSSDSSKEIARLFTDKVYDYVWNDDFSAARNFSFEHGTKEWLMWLDADDVISETSREKLAELKQNIPVDIDVVYMPYDISFDESGSPTFTYYRERIVRRSANPKWIEPVHEVIDVKGKTLYTDIAVMHKKIKQNPDGRNLRIMEKQLANGKSLSARLHFYYARELMFSGRTEEAAREFESVIADGGWSENMICACIDLSYCLETLGKPARALSAALDGLAYGVPRTKNLCRIAELFQRSGKLEESAYWYNAALNCPHSINLGFNETDYDGFIPAISLCVIYDRLGDTDKAKHFNDIAGKFKPDSPAYLYNKNYFENKK